MTENKNEKNFKNKNILHIVEILCLSAAAVFLSIMGANMLIDLTGLLCIITASALFACVLFLFSPGLILFAGAASFTITYLMCGDMIRATASLIYIIVGAIIYFGFGGKKHRTSITVGIASVLALFYMALIFFTVVISAGSFSVKAVVSNLDANLSNQVDGYIERYYSMLPQYSPAMMDDVQASELAALKKELSMNIKVMIPAIFMLYNLAAAYLSTAVFRTAYNLFIPMAHPGRKKIKNKYWRVNISIISATVLIAAMVLSAVVSNKNSLLPSIVFTNLIYILAPCFSIAGIYFVYDKLFKSHHSGAGLLPVFLAAGTVIFVLLFQFIAFAVLFFAVAVFMIFGLYATLIGDLKKFYDKTKKLLLGDDDDDDDDYID